MNGKIGFLAFVIALFVALGVFVLAGFSSGEGISKNPTDFKALSEKIDKVLKNQEDIIERLKDIRAQEDIIRIRASHK
jgi:hypothetical protein